MTYLDPTDPWPVHSRPEAQKALKAAAKAGWHFRKLSNHAFGQIKCSAFGQADACSYLVYSTSGPFDGSETAKAIRQRLRSCRHRAAADEQSDEPSRSDDELEQNVVRLLEAAEGLYGRAEATAEIDAAIERDDVEMLDRQHETQVRRDNEAQIAWTLLGRPLDPWPPAAGFDELLQEADRLIVTITDSRVAHELRSRLDKLRQLSRLHTTTDEVS